MLQQANRHNFEVVEHTADLCVVGGGMAGMLAAIAAARRGIHVVLMHDRPVLGGNASSEIRMWIRGAHDENLQETGILEELALENIYRNPTLNFSLWDSVLYEAVRFEPNIKLILNCSCNDLGMEDSSISWIKGWQTTTQTWHVVRAKYYADCSGDSVLAPLSGAEYRWGRESSDEFQESIEPQIADHMTMGMSCLMQARDTGSKKTFRAPAWANKYKKDDFPYRLNLEDPKAWSHSNFWWMELGGEHNCIHETEVLRDELLKVAFGAWDFIKNSGCCDADDWEIDWIGFLPGKRESRRYVGDHILNQNNVENEGHFDDIVAYGGWTMDDHHPGGLKHRGEPNVFHPAPSPYGIPYRCLYSKNISNLFFAGRNISATHAALSSTRVMATCAILGQAVGTAAVIAVQNDLSPREVYHNKINDLKQMLMDDDCYLPWNRRSCPDVTRQATIRTSHGDGQVLINGEDRPVDDQENIWTAPLLDSYIELDFGRSISVKQIRIVFDSDLNRNSWQHIDSQIKRFPMRCNIYKDQRAVIVPQTLVKSFVLEIPDSNGGWQIVYRNDNNYQRLNKINLDLKTAKIRFRPELTWGSQEARLFAFEAR